MTDGLFTDDELGGHVTSEALSAFFDGELTARDAESVREHVDACALCAGEGARLEALLAGLFSVRTGTETLPPLSEARRSAAVAAGLAAFDSAREESAGSVPTPRRRQALFAGAAAIALAGAVVAGTVALVDGHSGGAHFNAGAMAAPLVPSASDARGIASSATGTAALEVKAKRGLPEDASWAPGKTPAGYLREAGKASYQEVGRTVAALRPGEVRSYSLSHNSSGAEISLELRVAITIRRPAVAVVDHKVIGLAQTGSTDRRLQLSDVDTTGLRLVRQIFGRPR